MGEQLALPDLAAFMDDSKSLPAEIVAEIEAMKTDWDSENGLILNAAVPGLLSMTRQNWYECRKNYGFVVYRHFEKDFFSRRELEKFYKLRRQDGVQGPGRVSLKAMWQEANDDSVTGNSR